MMTTNAPEEKKKYYFDFFLFIGLVVSIILLVYDCQKKIEVKPNNFIKLCHTGSLKKYGLKNQNIVLDCMADGYPKPSITWFYFPTYSSNDNKFQLYNGSLKIINLSFGDRGYYTCEAKNAFGSKTIVYDLSVNMPYMDKNLDPSLLSITPAEQQYIERNKFDDVTLKCNANGKTTPTVAWYYNYERIGMTLFDKQWEFSDKNKFLLLNGDLRIIDLSLDDEGYYECEAINKYGLKKIWYSLTVKDEPKYQWISSDERRANFANRRLVKVNSGLSNNSYCIGRKKDEYGMRYYHPVFVSFNTGKAFDDFKKEAYSQTTNYELLEVFGNWEWKKVDNQTTIPNGAVKVDTSDSLIVKLDSSIIKVHTYQIISFLNQDQLLEILVVT